MAENEITIELSGKLSYKDNITIAKAAKIIAFLNSEGDDSGGGLLDGDPPDIGGARGKRAKNKQVENAREAIDVSGAKTNPEKIVALAAYVLQDGGATFKVEDVKAQFRRARETTPGNFPRDLSTAIAAGWIHEHDVDGEYELTSKVDGIFDGGFTFTKGAGSTKTASRTRSTAAKKPRATAGKPEVFAAIDEFPTRMEGFAPYAKMKNSRDKLLWAVMFAKKHGINGLTNKQIEWLTDELGDGIPNKQISATYNRARTPHGYVNKSTQDDTIRITETGRTYLATVGVSGD